MESLKHVLFLPMNMWGHTRPMCTLAARFVRLRPISITFFVAASLVDRAHAEVAADFLPGEEHLLARIRFVTLAQSPHPIDGAMYEAAFLAAWETLRSGGALDAHSVARDAEGALVARSVPLDLRASPLTAALLDMFMIGAFRTLWAASTTIGSKDDVKLPLYTWIPAATNCMAAWFTEDRVPDAEALAARAGVSFDEAAHQIIMGCTGRVIESSYLPPMYDHEIHPQGAPISPEFCGSVLIQVPRVLRDTDGVITMDAAEYHPEATRSLRAAFADTSPPRPVIYAGPLVSRASGNAPSSACSDVEAFLDAQLSARGERSVLLISFGSMFWPSDPAKLEAVLGVLVDAGVPFVMSCASPFSAISDETKSRLAAHGGAFLAKWLPQQAVLAHRATGWCLTHAGHNSVLECILAGVPMILWPIDADQAPNAVHLTSALAVAHELLEVRHGAGLGPVLRTGRVPLGTLDAVRAEFRGVLEKAFGFGRGGAGDEMDGANGGEGEGVRERLGVLRAKLAGAWGEGEEGVARREVEAFLDGL